MAFPHSSIKEVYNALVMKADVGSFTYGFLARI
jgi:hypothetical protein